MTRRYGLTGADMNMNYNPARECNICRKTLVFKDTVFVGKHRICDKCFKKAWKKVMK